MFLANDINNGIITPYDVYEHKVLSAQGTEDSNRDRSFKKNDHEFYYRRIDLNDLALGWEIVIKTDAN